MSRLLSRPVVLVLALVALATLGGAGCQNDASSPSSPDGGPTGFAPADPSTGAGPLSRVTAEACAEDVRNACTPEDNYNAGACSSDADCGGGACEDSYEACYCAESSCMSDDDCGADEACLCAGREASSDTELAYRNVCLPAECRTNDDCPGDARCALSFGGDGCCDHGSAVGLFCTSDADLCSSDDDCEEGDKCIYSEERSRFECGVAICVCD